MKKTARNLISAALAVVLVAGVIFVPSLGHNMAEAAVDYNDATIQALKEQIASLEEKSKELDAQYEIEKVLPPEPIVMPYELLPDVAARAALCYQAIGFLMQPVAGWNQVYAECGETHAVVEFQRSFGTLGEFYDIAATLMPAAFVQEIDEDRLRVQATLPTLETFASQDERDVDTVVRDITTAFQAIDTSVQTQVVVDTITNGVDVATVNVVEVGAESKLVPMQFMKIFEEFGGVYMMQASWDVRSRSWNYEVIIYAK